MSRSLLVCLMAFSLLAGKATAQFKLSAEIRPRAELRNGFKRPLQDIEEAALFIEQRTRLYLDFKNEHFELKIVPQDVRIWGDNSQAAKTDRALTNVQQAWAAYSFNDHHRMVAGRMELHYDNARLFGNLDWVQQGRSHDVLKYEYNANGFHLHTVAAFNQDSHIPEPNKLSSTYYSGLNNYKSMQFLWLNKSSGSLNASALLHNEGRQYAPDTVYYMQTAGMYGQWQLQPLTVSAEYYHQLGYNNEGKRTRGHLFSLQASVAAYGGVTVGAGADYLTGDDPTTATNEAFDPLYGTHHLFYGVMDYFYVGNPHQNTGLSDVYVKTAYHAPKQSVQLDVHRFSTAAAFMGSNGHLSHGSLLGWELDVIYTYRFDDTFRINAGYSHMVYMDAMRQVKQIDGTGKHASWAWLMFTYKPVLFSN